MQRQPASQRVLGLLLCGAIAGCGGGGGGGGNVAPPARVASADLEIASNTTVAELAVAVTDLPTPPPALMEVVIDLPPALTVAPTDPLTKVQAVPTLAGNRRGNQFVVICGDDQNPTAATLTNGELFRLRLVVTAPRQPGTHEITLRDAILARGDGSEAATESAPQIVSVTVR
ncbi:MAG: hypothetical protein NXI31_22830 [bacterium]|nr:hypothetical protein [bacterium]